MNTFDPSDDGWRRSVSGESPAGGGRPTIPTGGATSPSLLQLSHDEVVHWAMAEARQADRLAVVDAFLHGWETQRAPWRAALSALAVAARLPAHALAPAPLRGPDAPCVLCGAPPTMSFAMDQVLAQRHQGAIPSRHPLYLAAFLARQGQAPITVPSDYGVRSFIALLDEIDASEADETPSTLHRRLRRLPGTKLSVEESRRLLDTLGYCGILQTAQHRGFVHGYTDFLSPRKSRSSTWAYPVDFWKGRDGVDESALAHWFGAYPAIAGWRSRRRRH